MHQPLSAESIEKLERQVSTILQWPELELNDFLDDHKNHPEKILAMALTLKHYANPLGGYPTEKESVQQLKNIILCLSDPTYLQQQSKESLTENEKAYLIDLLRSTLDKLANDIIREKQISPETIRLAMQKAAPVQSTPGISQAEKEERYLAAWWAGLTTEERDKIQKRYHKELNPAQKKHLKQRVHYHYHFYPRNNLYYYNQMSLIDAELNFLLLNSVLRSNSMLLSPFSYYNSGYYFPRIRHHQGFSWYSHGHNHFSAPARGGISLGFLSGSSKSSSSNKGAAEVFLIAAAIAALVAFAISAFVATIYAAKKIANSVRNIFRGDKVLRSFYRLGMTAGTAALGAYYGSMAGGVLGSIIPGLGTAAGIILGGVLGAGLGAGIGAIIAKYSAKFVSAVVHSHEVNPSNPEKWRLNNKQRAFFIEQNVPIETVETEILRIKTEKSEIGVSGSFFWTNAYARKKALNNDLEEIKDGKVYKMAAYPPLYGFFTTPTPSAPPMERDYSVRDVGYGM